MKYSEDEKYKYVLCYSGVPSCWRVQPEDMPDPTKADPIPIILFCPMCGVQHIDEPDEGGHAHAASDGTETRWDNPPHRSHLCAACGCIWRPADVPTVGVEKIETHGKRDTFDPAKPVVLPRVAPTMTREQARIIAVDCARARPEGYFSDPFEPHDWVLDAILRAANSE